MNCLEKNRQYSYDIVKGFPRKVIKATFVWVISKWTEQRTEKYTVDNNDALGNYGDNDLLGLFHFSHLKGRSTLELEDAIPCSVREAHVNSDQAGTEKKIECSCGNVSGRRG